jgi:uncharacterized damage-inducible protein DinB
MEYQKTASSEPSSELLSLEKLIKYWQGHRQLTRKLIVAFPEDQFFSFSVGGMRSCAELMMELITLTAPGIQGIVTGQWKSVGEPQLDFNSPLPISKQEVLALWDSVTLQMDDAWKQMTVERAGETGAAFGMYEDTVVNSLLYLIDNEIHHRGQAYVYMRALGQEPPGFWERD